MPTKRKRIMRPATRALSEPVLQYLRFGFDAGLASAQARGGGAFAVIELHGLLLRHDRSMFSGVWNGARDRLLVEWITESPGTRPWAWWKVDAPEWTVDIPAKVTRELQHWPDMLRGIRQPRRRIGGTGTPGHEAFCGRPLLEYGISQTWVTPWQVAYYNGRATDIHGNRIGTDYRDGDFPFDALDATDLPRFESQAAYLNRHGLFMPGEERRLPTNAYDAEALTTD